MSRAGNMVGQFISVDYSTGPAKRPWTAEDAARLAGTFTIGGRATKPHVSTPGGAFVIGAISAWCSVIVGEKNGGGSITCKRRKRWATDKACREHGGAT